MLSRPTHSISRMSDTVDQTEFCARLLLHAAPGLGPGRLNPLIDKFSSARAILMASDKMLFRVPGIGCHTLMQLRKHVASQRDSAGREKSTLFAISQGYRLLMRGDTAYPDSLMQLSHGPPFLWLAGDSSALRSPAVAVIGTRRPSPEARTIAYNVGYSLAAAGYVVVSGMAYGIDAESHKGALDAGGLTIAVLGSGLLRVYPAIHRKLSARIQRSGAVISEFLLETDPLPGHFPRRNRIISGLCSATVVVEAYEKGGALITARLALDQNHDVYAFPGSSGNAAAGGTNRLIQSGEAQLVLSAGEIIADLDCSHPGMVFKDCSPTPVQDSSDSGTEESDADNSSPEKRGASESLPSKHISAAEILWELTEKPLHIDELSQRFGNRSPKTLVSLIKMESAGIVQRLPGGYFAARRVKSN